MAAACGAASARTPFQARCEDSIARAVAVLQSQQHGYSIDHSRSFHDLTRLKAPPQRGAYVLGLTRTESRVSVNLSGPILQDRSSGYECVAPQLRVTLYYAPIVVYIGREFPAGSCAYQAILAHEMRHLNTYLDHLPKVEKQVGAALERRFRGKPLYARIGQAQGLLAREIDTAWMPYIKRELNAVERLQAAIDTPQEYARLSKVCKGEVQSLIRAARSSR